MEDIEVFKKIYDLLQGLDTEDQERIIKSVCILLDIKL